MIHLGFKTFGLLSVLAFSALFGIILALKSTPPSYVVRPEVRDYLYPTAREHLKSKFDYFIRDITTGKKVEKFDISELELNAYLYYFMNDVLLVGGEPLFRDPYLTVKDNKLVLRMDVPMRHAIVLFSNGISKTKLDQSIKDLAEKKRAKTTSENSGFTLAITFVFSFHWVKDHPYFYLERVYAGVLPIPISVFLSDYQDQINTILWETFNKVFAFFPAYIRGMTVKNKGISVKTEAKMTDFVALTRRMDQFNKANPVLAKALEKQNCLYGCTPEEKAEMDKFFSKAAGKDANDMTPAELMKMKMMLSKMNRREKDIRQRNKVEMLKNGQGAEPVPDAIIYPEQTW